MGLQSTLQITLGVPPERQFAMRDFQHGEQIRGGEGKVTKEPNKKHQRVGRDGAGGDTPAREVGPVVTLVSTQRPGESCEDCTQGRGTEPRAASLAGWGLSSEHR